MERRGGRRSKRRGRKGRGDRKDRGEEGRDREGRRPGCWVLGVDTLQWISQFSALVAVVDSIDKMPW